MSLRVPRSLDNPWLDTDPTKRGLVIQAYRRWLWEHIELDREACIAGLDGGECDYGLIDPLGIEPNMPLDPDWKRDDKNGTDDPTRITAHQFCDISWRASKEDIEELLASDKAYLIVLGRAIRWTQDNWKK